MLPQKAVEEFKKLYEGRFGKKLDDAEAIRRANNFVNLYKAVYQSTLFNNANIETNFFRDDKLEDSKKFTDNK